MTILRCLHRAGLILVTFDWTEHRPPGLASPTGGDAPYRYTEVQVDVAGDGDGYLTALCPSVWRACHADAWEAYLALMRAGIIPVTHPIEACVRRWAAARGAEFRAVSDFVDPR